MTSKLRVDFLDTNQDRAARRTTASIAVVFTLLVAVLSALGAGASYRSVARGTDVLFEIGNLPVISDIRRLVLGGDVNAKDPTATEDGRLNIMLFGVGGAGHDGSQLTDTIMFASIDTKSDRVGIVSIPRDMAYPLDNGRFEKINAVNAYAEQDHPGEGAVRAAKDISKLLAVRVDHAIKIDFRGFEKFIDALGGVDVDVERSFTDTEYPTTDDLWQTVSFTKGSQHMNGARALIFVRSRHGSNGEGSDFARSRRQQLVMNAVRERLLSRGVLANPSKIAELWGVVSSNVQTDLSVWDIAKLAPLASRITRENVVMTVLAQDELAPANVEGSYMLFPRIPDWSEIRDVAANPFMTSEERRAKNKPATEVHLEVRNGTTRTGYAGLVADFLKKQGYAISGTGNATRRGYETSVIFDLTNGKKPTELARLKNMLNANVSASLPAWLSGSTTTRTVYAEGMTAEPISATNTDFLIILGDSSLALVQE